MMIMIPRKSREDWVVTRVPRILIGTLNNAASVGGALLLAPAADRLWNKLAEYPSLQGIFRHITVQAPDNGWVFWSSVGVGLLTGSLLFTGIEGLKMPASWVGEPILLSGKTKQWAAWACNQLPEKKQPLRDGDVQAEGLAAVKLYARVLGRLGVIGAIGVMKERALRQRQLLGGAAAMLESPTLNALKHSLQTRPLDRLFAGAMHYTIDRAVYGVTRAVTAASGISREYATQAAAATTATMAHLGGLLLAAPDQVAGFVGSVLPNTGVALRGMLLDTACGTLANAIDGVLFNKEFTVGKFATSTVEALAVNVPTSLANTAVSQHTKEVAGEHGFSQGQIIWTRTKIGIPKGIAYRVLGRSAAIALPVRLLMQVGIGLVAMAYAKIKTSTNGNAMPRTAPRATWRERYHSALGSVI